MESTILDAIDRQIIHIMTIEPRATFRTIAEVTGISDQTAARRCRKLSESAGLRILGVVNGPQAGWTDWYVRLRITPGSADAIGEALARRPDTKWVNLMRWRTASIGKEKLRRCRRRCLQRRDPRWPVH